MEGIAKYLATTTFLGQKHQPFCLQSKTAVTTLMLFDLKLCIMVIYTAATLGVEFLKKAGIFISTVQDITPFII